MTLSPYPPSSVFNILETEYILSPTVTKAKRKRMKKELEAKKKAAKKCWKLTAEKCMFLLAFYTSTMISNIPLHSST